MDKMYLLAQKIYEILCRYSHFVSPAVRRDLEQLYPEENREDLYRDYYVKKIEKTLMIFAAGSVLAIFLAVRAAQERTLKAGNALERGNLFSESRSVALEAQISGRREQFELLVAPRELDDLKTEEFLQKFRQDLPRLIAGKNDSLQEICGDLNLVEQYDGYPFLVTWKSGNGEWIAPDGSVTQGTEEKQILLTAQIRYGMREWEEPLTVRVLPETLTPERQQVRELEGLLSEAEKNTRTEEYLILPESVNGMPVKWQRITEDYSMVLWAGALIVGILVFWLEDKDLHDRLRKQQMQMKRDYPDMVHKLALYLGAGMTLRGALQKLASEYEKYGGSQGIRSSPVYEQLLHTCRELKSGVSESDAYERFGRKIGVQEYVRLCTLMIQSLNRGSDPLSVRLREEADRALTERIQSGRKLGEEASTKLLLPMVMMLAVVMIMVILPAFGSMGM